MVRSPENRGHASDLVVTVDAGAADRLRAAGFEVAHDGSQAVDVNGCDNTVFLVVRNWDGVSDVPREEWSPGQIAASMRMRPNVPDAVRTILTVDPASTARFIATWFDGAQDRRPEFGVRRVSVRGTTFEVRPAIAPDRQWIPLGACDYAAAVERCAAAGFDVVPSVTHPETAAHCDVGNVTFILAALP